MHPAKEMIHIDFGMTEKEEAAHAEMVREALSHCVMPGECQRVSAARQVSYMHFTDLCEVMDKQGQAQTKCQMCSLYKFPFEQCPLFQASDHE